MYLSRDSALHDSYCLKQNSFCQNHKVSLTGNVRSLQTKDEVCNYESLLPLGPFIFYSSAEKLTITFLRAKIQLDASGKKTVRPKYHHYVCLPHLVEWPFKIELEGSYNFLLSSPSNHFYLPILLSLFFPYVLALL